MTIALPFRSKNMMTTIMLILLSMLMVAYAPMASVSHAESAVETQKLSALQEKAMTEIDRRITKFQKTLDSLNTDATVSNDDSSTNATGDKGNTSITLDKNGLTTSVELSPATKDKVKQYLQKTIDQLKATRQKVKDAPTLKNMQTLGQNLDAQYQLTQLTDVQASVTSAIESMTGVFDKLQATAADLQSQITKVQECTQGIASGEAKVNVKAEKSDVSIDASAPGCDDFNTSSGEIAASSQAQMDSIKTIMTTISSVLMSSVALLTTLVSTFSSMAGGLGSLDSLGNLGNLGSITDLGSMTSSLGNISGLMSSFSAITSQLDIAGGMSSGASGDLSSLMNLINI